MMTSMSQHTVVRSAPLIGVLVGITVLVTSISGIAWQEDAANTQTGERGVMLMNRIGPSSSELFVARSDGTDERKLFAVPTIRKGAE